MIELASIQLNVADPAKSDVILFVRDFARVAQHPCGAELTFRDGTKLIVVETVAAIQTAIAALWTDYLAALGDPA